MWVGMSVAMACVTRHSRRAWGSGTPDRFLFLRPGGRGVAEYDIIVPSSRGRVVASASSSKWELLSAATSRWRGAGEVGGVSVEHWRWRAVRHFTAFCLTASWGLLRGGRREGTTGREGGVRSFQDNSTWLSPGQCGPVSMTADAPSSEET